MREKRPPRPDFKIGLVTGYAVHIYKSELPVWEQRDFVDAGGRPAIVPMPPDKVWAWGIPETIATVGSERLLGRTVKGFSTSLGTHGMGGCGFFGMQLAPDHNAEFNEYLVLPIWSATRFVWINGSPMFENDPPFEERANWRETLTNSFIEQVQLDTRKCNILLSKDEKTHTLTLYLDVPSSSIDNIHQEHYEEGQIADYLIFQDRRGMLTI